MDYRNEEGCCLTCVDASPGCMCFECKCTKCDYYCIENEHYRCSVCNDSVIEARARKEFISFWVDVERETVKGLAIWFKKEVIWLPKSKLFRTGQKQGSREDVGIPRWLCEAKGIPEELANEWL